MIRVERLRLDGAAQDNSLQLPLLTSMYLGDRWEYLFRTEGDDFRCAPTERRCAMPNTAI